MADKRELILDLLARDKTGQGTRSAAKNIGDVGDAAEKAGDKTEKLGHKAKAADEKAEKLGHQAGTLSRALGKLQDETAQSERELARLALAFAAADNAADRMDISKSMRKVQNDIRRLSASQGIIKKILPEPSADDGKSWGRKFVASLGSGIASSAGSIAEMVGKSPGMTIGAAFGTAAAPVLISTISSALSAGVGAGALGAGILLAVKGDPGIQAAGKKVGADFGEAMTSSAKKWLAEPIRQSIGVLDGASDRISKRWDSVFRSLSGSVLPFTRDVVQGVERISDALANVAEGSGPALGGLGDSFRLLADGAGDFIEILADGGPEAANNLRMIAGATADVLRYSGLVLKTFSDIGNNAWLTGPLLPLLRKHYKDAADASDELKNKTAGLPPAMDDAARAARGERDALTALATAMKAETDPVFGLLDASNQLRDAQKEVAKSTKEHGRKSIETQDALRKLATAAINMEDKAGALGKTFDGKMTPALKTTLRAAGLTEGQIRDLEKQFRTAKRTGEGFAKEYKAKASVTGTDGAIRKVRSLKQELASMKTRWTVTIRQNFLTFGKPYSPAGVKSGNVGGLATGGSVREGTPTWVGENGPELLLMDRPARVLSASSSRGVVQGGGTAGDRIEGMRLEVVGEREVVAFIRSLIRRYDLLQTGR